MVENSARLWLAIGRYRGTPRVDQKALSKLLFALGLLLSLPGKLPFLGSGLLLGRRERLLFLGPLVRLPLIACTLGRRLPLWTITQDPDDLLEQSIRLASA